MFFLAFLVSVFIILHTIIGISTGWSIFIIILVVFGTGYVKND